MILDDLDRVLTDFNGESLKEGSEDAQKDLTLRNLLRGTLLQDTQPADSKGVRLERYQLAKHILTAKESVELSAINVEMIMNRLEKMGLSTLILGIMHDILKAN